MFSRVFKKRKSRIFLGQLSIIPKEDWAKPLENRLFKSYDLEAELKQSLREIFVFMPLSERSDVDRSDLAIDIYIADYSGGEMDGAAIMDVMVPIFWRPKIELKSRVYNIETNKTVCVSRVKMKMDWGTYNARAFSFRGFFRIGPLFKKEEMQSLLYKASYELLLKIKKSVGT